jgi:hypothetical protein
MAGTASDGGGANVLSVPFTVIGVVTAIAWKARARLMLIEMATTLTVRTASLQLRKGCGWAGSRVTFAG